ncbi:unnamed protein product, partial [Meganyctiphanes norvegica]
ENSGGHKFLSHIIFFKFSQELRQAFSWECKTDYPTFKQILDSYCKVITSVVKNRRKQPSKPQAKAPPSQPKFQYKANKSEPNFHTQTLVPFKLHCRFCGVDGHSSLYCDNFVTANDRVNKCKELDLCIKCTSPKHKSDHCPGNHNNLYKPCKICDAKNHVSALCPKRKLEK